MLLAHDISSFYTQIHLKVWGKHEKFIYVVVNVYQYTFDLSGYVDKCPQSSREIHYPHISSLPLITLTLYGRDTGVRSWNIPRP